jgi:hypothetical protein
MKRFNSTENKLEYYVRLRRNIMHEMEVNSRAETVNSGKFRTLSEYTRYMTRLQKDLERVNKKLYNMHYNENERVQ